MRRDYLRMIFNLLSKNVQNVQWNELKSYYNNKLLLYEFCFKNLYANIIT